MERTKELQEMIDGFAKETEKEKMLFGPYGRGVYPEWAREQIEEKYGDGNAERVEMWRNLDLVQAAQDWTPNGNSVLDKLQKILGEYKSKKSEGLGNHLEEVTTFARKLFLTDDGKSRFREILDDRKALLLAEVVAPLHDSFKILGSEGAQTVADHRIIVSEFVRRNLVGGEVSLNGKREMLTEEDVDFVAGVVGEHENIFEEEEKEGWIDSDDEVERAVALFLVADTLTGVIEERGGVWRVNEEMMKKRFGDLCERHLDFERRKVFRPLWVAKTTKDLAKTIERLEEEGLKTDFQIGRVLVGAGLSAVESSKYGSDDEFLDAWQVKAELAEMEWGLRWGKKGYDLGEEFDNAMEVSGMGPEGVVILAFRVPRFPNVGGEYLPFGDSIVGWEALTAIGGADWAIGKIETGVPNNQKPWVRWQAGVLYVNQPAAKMIAEKNAPVSGA